MNSSPDPSVHRQREQRLVEHVQRLLDDERFRLDTTKGAKSVVTLVRDVGRFDGGVELTRLMSDMGVPDRDLKGRMPVGEGVEVTLSQKKWFFLKEVVGRLRVVCTSPVRHLLKGEPPAPLDTGALNKLLSAQPPSLGGVPQTILVMSTSGFTLEAHEVADRRADRTVILVEPNEAGGWTVTGPTVMKSLTDLLDPERDEEKRQRLRQHVEAHQHELAGSGLAGDRIAAKTQLSPQFVEAELKAYAKANPGLQAKRLDGRMVLFREGSVAAASSSSAAAGGGDAGGLSMPLLDRIKSLFARKGDEEKKISFLAERRTALSQQRDRAYEEMATLEQQEEALKRSFRETGAQITKKRVTTQLLQLRKDLERRHQLIGVLNQQVNVVSTHLHNLELVQQGNAAKLPDAEEITADAVRAEEMLAELEAAGELAGSSAPSGVSGMTAEEQALFDELEAENKHAAAAAAQAPAVKQPSGAAREPAKAVASAPATAAPDQAPVADRPERRSEPEAG
ncbi:MAG: hypothetical protein AVDCRST_MAG64-2681 [uncultured Phycisphaerae bacterium]|uniref:Uncharacterized protein n=1 Tax=uncultured Phycisphaerae bacterium TaxID=904963 RepID=A0A6J4PJK1_9BACT|nr:MAG: hypothetical protein AVDCRST_MAG64-2681 [uncultured Phycisphaerae bacterium]